MLRIVLFCVALPIFCGAAFIAGARMNEADVKAEFSAPQEVKEWGYGVYTPGHPDQRISRFNALVFKHGRDTCYVFIQDFGQPERQDAYRAILTSSCVRSLF